MGEEIINEPTEIVTESNEFFTPEGFDIFDILTERAYPKDTVTVYLDEEAAYQLRALGREADSIEGEPDQDVVDSFAERLATFRARIERSARTFHLTGVDADKMKDVMTAAEAHFEDRKVNRKRADGSIIRELPQSAQTDFMRYASALTLSIHVEKITDPDGHEVVAPGPDILMNFLDKAPVYAVRELNQAIERLTVDARDFERGLDDGFFPKP